MKIKLIFILNLAIAFFFIANIKIQAQEQSFSGNFISTKLESTSQNTDIIEKSALSKEELVPSPQLAMSSTDYLVTAGDIYSLAFSAGNKPITYYISVDSTYKIRVANLAVINAEGLTFVQLKKQIEEIVTKNFPMSGVQFVLLTPAVFKVTIIGEVKTLSIKQAWALTRLSSVLENCNTYYSSNRIVKIKSTSGVVRQYDLFKAERFGDLNQDPYIRPDDTIIVERALRKVTISGAVERPGTYEILDNEQLEKLISYYGNGLTSRADLSRMELSRLITKTQTAGKKIYLSEKDYNQNFKLEEYDEIYIPTYADLTPVVFFEGALFIKGNNTLQNSNKQTVHFTPGENYASLIRRNKSIFSQSSDLENVYILRNEEKIDLPANKILYDATYYSKTPVLMNDIIIVPFKQYFITVTGAVNNPGRYPYVPDRDANYYIGLAGGFTEQNSFNSFEIKNLEGISINKTNFLTPESTIVVKRNSFLHRFNQYAPVITTVLSIVVSGLTVYSITK